MEVYVSNLNSRTNQEELRNALRIVLLPFGIQIYDVRKKVGKTFAFLTLPDSSKANAFLSSGQAAQKDLSTTPISRAVRFQRNTKRPHPDTQLLRVLHKEEKDLETKKASKGIGKGNFDRHEHSDSEQFGFDISTLQCGFWETSAEGKRKFTAYFDHRGKAKLIKSRREFVINVPTNPKYEFVIDLASIASVAIASVQQRSAVIITLDLSPKFYEQQDTEADPNLFAMLNMLAISRSQARGQTPTRFRNTKLPDMQQIMAGSCLAYRLILAVETTSEVLSRRLRSMISDQAPVLTLSGSTALVPVFDFQEQVHQLDGNMKSLTASFGWRFQVQALWSNGLLSPNEIIQLIPLMVSIKNDSGERALIKILQRLTTQLRLSDVQMGGFAEAAEIMQQQKSFFLQESEEESRQASSRDEVTVHRVVVTPAGIYLYGPEEVAANRILRKYRKHQDHFLRVSFTDEAEDRIQFDRDISNERVLSGRFLTILRKGLDIAGVHFEFLGFSHSSLRSQTCWFMSPFVEDDSLLFAQALIKSLGDFSSIRVPAKCAARIGQAFSDTTSAIQVDPKIVSQTPDIENGDRNFTDGCGTVSKPVWMRLQKATSTAQQPTLYQIRYKGKSSAAIRDD